MTVEPFREHGQDARKSSEADGVEDDALGIGSAPLITPTKGVTLEPRTVAKKGGDDAYENIPCTD